MTNRVTRRGFLIASGTAALAGCTGGSGRGPTPDRDPASAIDGGAAAGSGDGSTPAGTATPGRAGPPTAEHSLPLPREPAGLRKAVRSGGQPKDGIPSIDEPKFESASAADDRLDPNSVVFGLARDGAAKAYPQSILVWHEICNDVVGGEPVSVTYCPLTGTVLGFERGETTFGVSGRLINNNLVMYDRATERWWPQVLATSIPGPWSDAPTGQALREFRLIWTTWERWKRRHPETEVLTSQTGFARSYGSDPYGGYDPPRKQGYYASNEPPLFPALSNDDRFPPKKVVIGARTPEGAIAFPKDSLRERKVIEGAVGGTPHIGVYDPGLNTGYVYRNPDGIDFEFGNGEVTGPDGTHAPDALPLDRVHAFDAMWFAWAGFYPETVVSPPPA